MAWRDGSSIVLDRDVIAALPTVRELLVRQEDPPREEALRGLVASLHQDVFDDEESAEATVQADVRGRVRNVRGAGTELSVAQAALTTLTSAATTPPTKRHQTTSPG